jgi:hypothetical protein
MTVVFFFATGIISGGVDRAGQAMPRGATDLALVEEVMPMPVDMTSDPQGQTIQITGVRLTQGNAVDCPQVRDDSGVIHTVSYLSPGVKIGARVTVTGFYAVTTHCIGTVLVVRDEQSPDN